MRDRQLGAKIGRASARPAVWAGALLIGSAVPLTGQVVDGRLLDAATGDPVAEAMVALLDGEGVERDRRMSGGSGQFRLMVDGPAPYAIVVERIGFRRHEVPVEDLGRELELRLLAEPIELPGVTVSTEPVCSISSAATGGALGDAWELVRATLARTTLGSADGDAVFDVATYSGEMDPELNFREVVADTAVKREGAPFAFVDSATLEDTGWAEDLGDRRVRYFAPSPGLLVSPWFQANHCFALEAEGPDTLLLLFRSAPEMTGAGIEGAFVISRSAARVAKVEFRHLAAGPPAEQQGGEIVLARTRGDSWYVREWWMRTPIFKSRPTNFGGPSGLRLPRWRKELTGYRFRGGAAVERPRPPPRPPSGAHALPIAAP